MARDPYSILLFQWIAEKGLPRRPLWKKQSRDTTGRALGLHLLNSAGKKQTFASGNCFPDWREFIFQFVIWIIFGIFQHFFSKLSFFATIPHDHLQQLLELINPGLAWGGPGHKARRRQDKCSRNAAPEGRAAWCTHGRCVLGSCRKEKGWEELWSNKKQRSLCFGLGGQKSGLRRFLFINGMFAMKIHALTVYI